MGIKRAVSALALGLMTLGGGLVAAQPAVAAPAAPADVSAQMGCGFGVVDGWAKYNHCGSGWITIRVRWFIAGVAEKDRCVGPGITNLEDGTPADRFITNAWYIGGC
ncbi:DUF6355 family natural product biosynthesis protein [Amycolatopsis magusensis]|uniref:Alpha amylase inhibitor n=1 Tax=Amycolatopsis magusensis TaxID=882444 RepID=A0ABS4PRW1_9PSEU|nr:DUF6355 family natural product biosynthesis protein [Amycolatopsis magusensis]MBP2181640.1 hypothetical protein [Amycolatopsis magusensis]MDI5975812.1 DUF6355 family natural product biosynthesis protein [Amycolatopsis magusensis]UJW32144.1 DUF6355 family natural product biosynthesis protein [Saccharothrix sp. AJ9571]